MSRIRSIHPDTWEAASRWGGSGAHVYVIEEENGPVKIGIARNAFWRKADLQSGNVRQLQLRAVYQCDTRYEAAAIEKAVLDKFSDARLRGEWLLASFADVVAFIEMSNEVHKP